jgi:hypothetical protein
MQYLLIVNQEIAGSSPVGTVMIEKYIKQYGEKYRNLFTDALKWLEETEPKWKLDEPIDKDEFIKEIVDRVCITDNVD